LFSIVLLRVLRGFSPCSQRLKALRRCFVYADRCEAESSIAVVADSPEAVPVTTIRLNSDCC